MMFAQLDTSKYRSGMMEAGKLRSEIGIIVNRFSEMIANRIRQNMAAPHSGKLYTMPGGGVHMAAAPGEAPAVETGALFNAVEVKFFRNGMAAEIGVFGGLPYAAAQEYGKSDMAARPYVEPAFKEYEEKFVLMLQLMVAGSTTYAASV